MAKVQIIDVEVLDNPSNFFNPFQFQITFDCMENLRDDLEWKIIYVGSAESEACDQILDSVLVGPIPAGRHKFVFQADPPKPELIPVQDAVGVTVVIITCTYHGHEFVRVGYYVNNEYAEPELRETPPDKPDFNKLTRNILSSAPRVTRFKINWDDSAGTSTADGGQTYETLEENIPPSPEDVQHTMAENSKDSICANRDSNGPLSSSVLNSENIRKLVSQALVSRYLPVLKTLLMQWKLKCC
nr:histone chaperone ASF1A-like [Ciona intestinalis]|eukprot:XP_002129912.1 histone chaperone ASF1A-like [Ciona intestinalis]